MTSGPVVVSAPRRRVYWQTAVTVAVLVGTVCLARRHWPMLERGAVRLAVADQGWLLVGGVAAAATWVCAALAQQGAVVPRLPQGRLVAAQFAAGAANHLLPAGLGAGAVNLRFLMRCGLTAGRAVSALAVKGTAAAVVRAVLIVTLVAACPGMLRMPRPHLVVLAVLCAAAVCVTVLLAWSRCRRALATVLADIRAVHANPPRAAALWGGQLAFAALHALVLIAVTQAVALSLPPARVALLYVAASSAAALLPTPGGLGSLDAALAFALTASGATGTAAASAVLGYRLLTVWLPLIPGLVVLAVLVRRKAL
ncbi:lysylphosphatidylglycerol synthase transmembrane domain-containing protein [Streptomyces justiciae]|uniref:lysylphosphatidylglycerol synthase transmembrane domain-containing protein n=1 Tax=Streptomyces justiciae TaxID=2780140 RepID=UPI00211966A3|nr:lysylphosphatidylglycerol synthase domain-containing protein [Streptomyces justiciae]MCW8381771.1 flippase-like domain-containing protein [Streptomyces justiciae]